MNFQIFLIFNQKIPNESFKPFDLQTSTNTDLNFQLHFENQLLKSTDETKKNLKSSKRYDSEKKYEQNNDQ